MFTSFGMAVYLGVWPNHVTRLWTSLIPTGLDRGQMFLKLEWNGFVIQRGLSHLTGQRAPSVINIPFLEFQKNTWPKSGSRASLLAQWLRICLPMQGTWFKPWSGKIPHAAEQLGPWATATEPARLEPVFRNKRGRDSERAAHRNEEWPPLATTRESPRTETKTQHSHK